MPDSDALFASLVVEQRLATREQVDECVRLKQRLAEAGTAPLPSLGQLLVQRGYLTAVQHDRTIRLSGSAIPAPLTEPGPKYTRKDLLGSGGMGEVWKAWDNELQRWVALKFLKVDDPDEVARFRREAQTAAKLNHPNIAAVYEATGHYIAMQFVDGQTMSSVPRDDRRRLATLLRDAARAVHFAHEHGIIHRDIKPANIMVENDRVFVMDFGLARQTNVRTSLSGTIAGTPAYMSPEQARGAQTDGRTDVYGLGATLYELVADRPPFRGKDVYDVIRKVIEQDPKPVPGDLGTIAMKCLEKEPARRYRSADELAQDLTRYLDGEPIRAHPPSWAYRLRKHLAKRRAVVAMAAAGLALAAAVAAFLVPRWVREAEARKLAEAARSKEEAARRQVERYAKYEKDLDLLAMRFYQKDFRFTEKVFGEYNDLEKNVLVQMDTTGPSAQGWYLIGHSREARADLEGAHEAYDKAIAISPRHAGSLLRKGRLLTAAALLEGRMSDVTKEIRAEMEERAAEGLRLVEEAGDAGESMDLDLARAYVEILRRWGRGWRYEAAPLLRKWSGRPLVEEFLLLECISGEDSAMETALTKLLDLVPSYPAAYVERGAVRRIHGRFADAIKDFDRALEINPRDAEACVERGLTRFAAGDFEGAIQDCSLAISWQPRLARAYLNRSAARLHIKDDAGAIEDATRAIELDPRCAEAHVNRGNGFANKGDYEAAISDYGKALEINPHLVNAWVCRGSARANKGDHEGAIQDATRAIELNAGDPEAHGTRAYAKEKKGDLEGALRDAEAALRFAPSDWSLRPWTEQMRDRIRSKLKK